MGSESGTASSGSTLHHLKALPETVHWGYFDRDRPAVLAIRSGDLVSVEAVTHRAGDAPELLMDAGIARLYDQVTERGPGGHILTGPILVEGAEPGDALEARILDLRPRLPYGSNCASRAGYLIEEFGGQMQATIYELDLASASATALFRYPLPEGGLTFGQRVEARTRIAVPVPRRASVPLRLHLGIAGVAPEEAGRVSSVPPGRHGGNVDNWRFGVGSRMYYPVLVPGALFSLGDPHVAQGDAELNGTAVEASLDVLVQLTLHKGQRLRNPLLETPTHLITHGFDEDLNTAMHAAAMEMLALLVTRFGLMREDAYSLMSVAVDFGVTQVVDQRRGIHGCLPKALFAPGFQNMQGAQMMVRGAQ